MTEFPTVPYRREKLSHQAMVATATEFRDTLRMRRTVRDFSREPIPAGVIDLALDAANSAPSGANIQPWKFVLVEDVALKREIRVAAEKEEYENYNGRMPDEWLHALAPLQTDWHKEFLEIAPVLLVVFKEEYGVGPGTSKVTHYYVNESVGIACGFLLAALNAVGLATLTHTPSPMGFLRQILGRPKNEKPFLLVVAGYPAEGCRVPDLEKKNLGDVRLVK